MLYIAEKPELARAIVEGLGGGDKKKGYYLCGRHHVTWCFGHMLQLLDPEEYNASYQTWSLGDLPLAVLPARKKPNPKTKDQLNVILKLLKKADTVVHAGDPDDEGQLLVDEILAFGNYTGPVKRLLINDNTPQLVKKALDNLRDNAEFSGLSKAAEARQIGDYVYGLNLTRLYTLAARQEGYAGVLSIGRVQTPILGLVVRRDKEHADHQMQTYYCVDATLRIGDSEIVAAYQPETDDAKDEKGRLTDGDACRRLADSLTGKTGEVKSVDVEPGETPPPLPYNLLKLQSDASRLYGYLPDQIKEITQALREKYRLITYNRSDCQYLSEEQHQDAPAVMAALTANMPDLAAYLTATDTSIKSRAFDSGKITAHHAIVPTQATVDFSQLTDDEKRVYQLIARAYAAQFMSPHTWEKTTAIIEIDGHTCIWTARTTTAPGWKTLFDSSSDNDNADTDVVPPLTVGDSSTSIRGACRELHTKPKPLYTMATLLEDLTRVAQYIRDDDLRRILVEKDKDKNGEHGGIGTPATRDTIIKTLFDRGFIETHKKGSTTNVVSTKAGREFYDILPDSVKFPDVTALWLELQQEIESGKLTVDSFLDDVVGHIASEIARVVSSGLGLNIEIHPCPHCGKALLRRKGTHGYFWSCSGFPSCRTAVPDDNGMPAHMQDAPIVSEVHKCPDCGSGLIRRPGKKKDTFFWGCSKFPKCRNAFPDKDGAPNYTAPKRPKHHNN